MWIKFQEFHDLDSTIPLWIFSYDIVELQPCHAGTVIILRCGKVHTIMGDPDDLAEFLSGINGAPTFHYPETEEEKTEHEQRRRKTRSELITGN